MNTVNIISLVGSSISLLFSVLTFLHFTVNRELVRSKEIHRRAFFLRNLSVALTLLNSTLIASFCDGVISDPNGCLAVAVIVQFSLTSVSMWLMADIFNLYFFTFKTKDYLTKMTDERIFLPARIRSWALPAVFVGILVAVDKNYYAMNDQRCWIQRTNILIFTIPSSIIISIDVLLYAGLIVKMFFIGEPNLEIAPNLKQQKRHLFESILLYLSLFGMWLFGFDIIDTSANQSVTTAFACVFAIFNSTFGITLLILSILADNTHNTIRTEINLTQPQTQIYE